MATQRICDACGVVLEGGPKWELREMLPVTNATSRPIKTFELCSSGCLVEAIERGALQVELDPDDPRVVRP